MGECEAEVVERDEAGAKALVWSRKDDTNTILENAADVDHCILVGGRGKTKLLPDEIWAKIFEAAGFPLAIAQTCKRWHRLYFQTFCYASPTIEWIDSYISNPFDDSMKEAARRACIGVRELMEKENRSTVTIFPASELAQSVFHICVLEGMTDIVRHMLEHDYRIAPDAERNSAVQKASASGNVEMVKLLLSDPRVDASMDGNWALRVAANRGHIEVVKVLQDDIKVKAYATCLRQERANSCCSMFQANVILTKMVEKAEESNAIQVNDASH